MTCHYILLTVTSPWQYLTNARPNTSVSDEEYTWCTINPGMSFYNDNNAVLNISITYGVSFPVLLPFDAGYD